MIALADPRPDVACLVEYRVDADAAPGNVIPALARLLIDLDRRRRAEQQLGASTDEA
jgi:hypothetical protein